jgi:hypothetical protein
MVAPSSEDTILKRLIGSAKADFPPEVARFFAELSFTEYDQRRMALLSEKANEGDLTPEERDELATYILINDFLAIVQSRARTTLKDKSQAA